MAIELIRTIQRWTGLSTDTKPTTATTGSIFDELDTSIRYLWDGTGWVNIGGVTWPLS